MKSSNLVFFISQLLDDESIWYVHLPNNTTTTPGSLNRSYGIFVFSFFKQVPAIDRKLHLSRADRNRPENRKVS
jgi:hypothetical protein